MDAVFVGAMVLTTLAIGAGALHFVRRLARIDRPPAN